MANELKAAVESGDAREYYFACGRWGVTEPNLPEFYEEGEGLVKADEIMETMPRDQRTSLERTARERQVPRSVLLVRTKAALRGKQYNEQGDFFEAIGPLVELMGDSVPGKIELKHLGENRDGSTSFNRRYVIGGREFTEYCHYDYEESRGSVEDALNTGVNNLKFGFPKRDIRETSRKTHRVRFKLEKKKGDEE
jgi:hypothetical protein